MLRSLYSGISGLMINQQSMDVIGNNISNVNTTGYKTGRTVFQDLLSQTLVSGSAPSDTSGGTNPMQVGLGGFLASVDNIFENGSLQTTSKNTDLAIQGDGFFVVRGVQETDKMYTRAGDFSFDTDGNLVTPAGYRVQGWLADPVTGQLTADTAVGDIVIDETYQTTEAKATTEIAISGVLNTDAEATVFEFPTLLHYAEGSDSIYSVFSTNGVGIDLSDNEPVRVKAHGTILTDMNGLYNDTDVSLDLDTNPNIQIYINNTAYGFTYVQSGATPADLTGQTFTTMEDLAAAIEARIEDITGANEFTVSVGSGAFTVRRDTNTSAVDIAINSFSGSPYLAVALNDLTGTYNNATDTRTSEEMYFRETYYAGRDFTTLDELAADIEAAIDNNVLLSGNFSTTFNAATGQFEFNNSGLVASGDLTLSGFSIDKGYNGTVFESNIVPTTAKLIAPESVATSEDFLRYAKGSDLLTDLFTTSGDTLGLDATAIIQYSASIGGDELTGTGNLAVAGSTLDDMREMIATYMGYDFANETELQQYLADVESSSGSLVLTGNKGVDNEIDFVEFEIVGGQPSYDSFYSYFNYETTQSASGGELLTSQTIYDAQGEAHVVQYHFTMSDDLDNVWKLSLETTDPTQSATFNSIGGNEVLLHFNSDGSFNYITDTSGTRLASLSYDFEPNTGAGVISGIDMDLGTAAAFDGVYISATESSISRTDQDGYPVGDLEETLFNSDGEIIGYYTNGNVKVLGQVALSVFKNSQGLLKVGDTLFKETANSGEPAIGKANTSFRGSIAAGALENSNVDLSREFVNMITTQRGFQANSRVITTSDEMLQELMTLKR